MASPTAPVAPTTATSYLPDILSLFLKLKS
jgi:hypothetical protein